MTNEELQKDWRKYGVETSDGIVVPLRERFAACWGWSEKYGGLQFDTGGPVGEMWLLIVEDDNLLSVNHKNHEERNILGKLLLMP